MKILLIIVISSLPKIYMDWDSMKDSQDKMLKELKEKLTKVMESTKGKS